MWQDCSTGMEALVDMGGNRCVVMRAWKWLDVRHHRSPPPGAKHPPLVLQHHPARRGAVRLPEPHLDRAQGQGIIQQVCQGRGILPCDWLDMIFTVLLPMLQ